MANIDIDVETYSYNVYTATLDDLTNAVELSNNESAGEAPRFCCV